MDWFNKYVELRRLERAAYDAENSNVMKLARDEIERILETIPVFLYNQPVKLFTGTKIVVYLRTVYKYGDRYFLKDKRRLWEVEKIEEGQAWTLK